MKTKLLLFAATLLFSQHIFACGGLNQQVYTGEIKYARNDTNPLTITVFVTLDFDVPDVLNKDSIMIDWGNGIQKIIFADSIIADSVGNVIQDYPRFFKHYYSGTYTYSSYPASGFYYVSVASQFRISYVTNIAGGSNVNLPYYIEAAVGLDSLAPVAYLSTPVLQPLTISYGYTDASFVEPVFLNDPETDSLVFDLITPLEGHGSPVPLYLLPDDFCAQAGEPAVFSINHQSGEIIWSNPCFNGIFTLTTRISKFRNGQLLGYIMRDENVFVSGHSATGIAPIAENKISVFPNPASSFIQVQTTEPLSICIINLLGETVLHKNISSSSSIDISDLSHGIYFIRNEKTAAVAKFVKE